MLIKEVAVTESEVRPTAPCVEEEPPSRKTVKKTKVNRDTCRNLLRSSINVSVCK